MRYLFLSLVMLSACGSAKDGVNHNEKKEKYQYHFNENGCDTGEQKFSSKKTYCEALKDESRNKGCAFFSRMEAYDRDCD